MKPFIGIIIAIAAIGGGYYYFMQPQITPEGATNTEINELMTIESVTQPEIGTYTVITAQSEVGWAGAKPLIPGYVHRGIIPVSSGTIVISEEDASGSFALDMTNIEVTSMGGGKAGAESALESHLRNSDFFDVATYPTATFEITSVTQTETKHRYTITGDLTLKNTTESVSFPATIYQKDGQLFADAEFSINRTRWDITLGSSTFFDGLANNAIDDEVTLALNLVAEK